MNFKLIISHTNAGKALCKMIQGPKIIATPNKNVLTSFNNPLKNLYELPISVLAKFSLPNFLTIIPKWLNVYL